MSKFNKLYQEIKESCCSRREHLTLAEVTKVFDDGLQFLMLRDWAANQTPKTLNKKDPNYLKLESEVIKYFDKPGINEMYRKDLENLKWYFILVKIADDHKLWSVGKIN